MSKAIVVLSGGQDSTTCLYLARTMFDEVEAISFDYGQRHRVELDAARDIIDLINVQHYGIAPKFPRGLADVTHRVVNLRGYGGIAGSALTDEDKPVAADGGPGPDALKHLPSTFTPGRNLVFLTVAASFAISRGVHDLVTGVCQTDFSGYPDCRRDTIDQLEKTIALGNDLKRFTIHTPLMWLTKAESVRLARRLPGCWEALKKTVTCYHGRVPGCDDCPSACPACALRGKGFTEAGYVDPARE